MVGMAPREEIQMNRTSYHRKCLVFVLVILFAYTAGPRKVCSQEEGVALGEPDIVQQEIVPFVPLNQLLVLDPTRGNIILLFPGRAAPKDFRQAGSEVKTERTVIRQTNINTETGTLRGTTRNRNE
jgi:hypothetical protein